MATINEIKNLAIAELGFVDEIDFTSVTDPTAIKVNRLYDTTKDFILSNYRWAFLMKRAILSNPIQISDTFTADAGTDYITMASTDRTVWDGLEVTLTTTTTLPAGLSLATTYYIINASVNTCQLSATSGGTAIDITDTGTGTHTITFNAVNKSPYKYLYNTPTDVLSFRNAYTDRGCTSVISDYEYMPDGFFTNSIYSTDKSIRFWYASDLDESLWPGYFVAYFKYALALDLCFLLTGDTEREKVLAGMTGEMLRACKTTDAKQVKTKTVKRSPYVDIRSRGIGNGNGIS